MKRKKRSISDKERLDWIQKHRALVDASCANQKHVDVQGDTLPFGIGRTVREAIDYCVRADRASRKEK